MKTINETFTEEEFKKLQRTKKKSNAKTWHDYLLLPTEEIELKCIDTWKLLMELESRGVYWFTVDPEEGYSIEKGKHGSKYDIVRTGKGLATIVIIEDKKEDEDDS